MTGKKGCHEGFIQGSGRSELTDMGWGEVVTVSFPLPWPHPSFSTSEVNPGSLLPAPPGGLL